MTQNELEQYLKRKEEYLSPNVIREIEKLRTDAIAAQDEVQANHFWCLAVIFYIKQSFTNMYQNLKAKRYLDAYNFLKQTDLQLVTLAQNFDIGNENDDPYQLFFIKIMLEEYAMLFPYEYFVCYEQIVKEERCSICNQKVRLRGGCNHVPGKVYMGEVCVHEVINPETFPLKVTVDPFDKYDILQPVQSPQINYKYDMLDSLMANLSSPYDYWEVEIVKEKNKEFARIGRNDKCPCGSGKKFKQCCMNNEEKMYFEHYKIRMLNDVDHTVSQPLKML